MYSCAQGTNTKQSLWCSEIAKDRSLPPSLFVLLSLPSPPLLSPPLLFLSGGWVWYQPCGETHQGDNGAERDIMFDILPVRQPPIPHPDRLRIVHQIAI